MTFGAIKSRIADEMMRPDLASQIALAVTDAIGEAATNRFWFNEMRGLTFTTVAGQSFYDATALADISRLSRIDNAWATINGQRRMMSEETALTIADWLEGQETLTGEPWAYARQANGLLLWMTPRDAYPITIDGVTRFAPLANDADENAWTTEGERYIRALAKANTWENVVRDFDEADRQWQVAERERQILLRETANRLTTNTVMAYL